MPHDRFFQRPRRVVAALFVCLSLGACSGYHAEATPEPSPNTLVARRARVTRANGASLQLVNAIVRGDTLYGAQETPGGASVAIALRDIRHFEVRQPKAAATAVMMAAGLAAVAFGTYLALGYPDS